MAIVIKQKDSKWVLKIIEEEWEFETLQELKDVLLNLIYYKEKYLPKKK